MKRFHRSDRLSEELIKELSSIIQKDIKDPRIGSFVSVVKLRLSKDLKNATVYISVYGSDDEKTGTMAALVSGAGFIRNLIGKRMRIRAVPTFFFQLDDSIEYSSKIQKILHDTAEEDQRNHDPE